MKNKRTKLTALALSALMAVSTISSVTWAADLFSDGSDGTEDVTDEVIDIVSDVEDENASEDYALVGKDLAITDNITVKFSVENGNVVARYTDRTDPSNPSVKPATVEMVSGTKKPASCFFPERAQYVAKFSVGDADYTIYSDGTGAGGPTKVKYSDHANNASDSLVELDTSCYKWTDIKGGTYDITNPSPVDKFEYNGKFFSVVLPTTEEFDKNDGYIIVPGGKALGGIYGHSYPVPRKNIFKEATCTENGVEYNYYGCEWCEEGYINYKKEQYENIPKSKLDANFFDSLGIEPDIVSKNDHNFEGATLQVLTDKDFIYAVDGKEEGTNGITHPYAVANGEAVRVNPSSKVAGYELENDKELVDYAPFNCIGTEIADPENGKDAFYYTYVVCKTCNKVIQIKEKVYLKDTSGFVEGDYYEEVDGGNVLGFLAKSGYGDTPVDGDYIYGTISKYISFENAPKGRIKVNNEGLLTPLVPVLSNCNQNGYYYIRKYVKDSPEPVSTKRITVERISHVWGSIEVAPKGTKYADGKESATVDANLLSITDDNLTAAELKNPSGKFVVVRDASGNVIEAKSKNCITTANYELYHQCLICGAKVKTETKTAQYNTDRHWWPEWSKTTDDEDNKYYQIEGPEHDTYHMKYTYYHRICNRCGERQTQLADEVKEPHNLIETQFDKEGEDDTLVPATCGEPGHYDVILRCECEYEDSESRKQAIIPATDKHDFGSNPVELQIVGDIQVGGRGVSGEKETDVASHTVYAYLARKCNVCQKYDSNGINNTLPGTGGKILDESIPAIGPTVIVDTVVEGRTFTDYKEPKKDEKTGVPYPCSTGFITVNFNWAGKVDGEETKTVKFSDSKTVPYYANEQTFAGSRAHQADDVRIVEKVDATTEAPGYYVQETYCSVCGEKVATEKVPIAQIGSAPSVKASVSNYNTIDISWDAVEDADYYILYYKSADLGITTWRRVRTVNGTSFTHSGLVTGAKYRYTVRAVLDGVKGAYDRTGSVAIPKLAAPENISVTAVSGKNKVSWSKVDGANGYIIQRSSGNGWSRVGSVKKGAKVTWTDKKPVSGATYRVRAYRTVNDANFSKNNVYSAFSAAK